MKLTKARLKQIIKEEIEDIAAGEELGTTEPVFDTSPEGKLLNLIRAGEILSKQGTTAEEIAAGLGVADDEEVIELIRQLITPGASLASVGR